MVLVALAFDPQAFLPILSILYLSESANEVSPIGLARCTLHQVLPSLAPLCRQPRSLSLSSPTPLSVFGVETRISVVVAPPLPPSLLSARKVPTNLALWGSPSAQILSSIRSSL